MPALAPDRPASQQFALSDMEDYAKEQGIDTTAEAPAVEGAPEPAPSRMSHDAEKPAEAAPEVPAAEPTPEPVPEAASTEDALRAHAEEEEKKLAEAKVQEGEQAKVEEAKAEPATPPNPRDSDLDDAKAPHVSPKMRQVVEAKNNKIREARDRADAADKATAELKARAEAAEAKASGVGVPKEVEEELKSLRERVRELDISRDPEIEAKYDKRIKANSDSIVDTLKEYGYGRSVVGEGENAKEVENPRAVAELIKNGINYDNLQPLIEKLKTKGLHGAARKIERLIDQNENLAEERHAEIERWKGTYETRQKERQNAATADSERQIAAVSDQTKTHLRTELEVLAKDFPFINAPPAPLQSDSPAVAKIKQAAVDSFNAAAKKIGEIVKGFNADGLPPEKAQEVVGRRNAAAVQAVVIKEHILPRLKADLSTANARIKQLEADIGKLKGAGSLSRQHATQATGGGVNMSSIPKDAPLADSMAEFARQSGLNVNG